MSSQKPLDQGQSHSVTPVPELQRIWFTESIRLPLGRAVLKLAWQKQALSSFYVSKEHDFKSTHITQPSQAGPPWSLGRTVVHQLCISGRTCGALALQQALSWMDALSTFAGQMLAQRDVHNSCGHTSLSQTRTRRRGEAEPLAGGAFSLDSWLSSSGLAALPMSARFIPTAPCDIQMTLFVS